MKKEYIKPMTENYVMSANAVMQTTSIDGKTMKQDLGATLESTDDDGSNDLAKGGSIWDAWD